LAVNAAEQIVARKLREPVSQSAFVIQRGRYCAGRVNPAAGRLTKRMQDTPSTVELDFVNDIGTLPPERLLRFYEVLSHNLTVTVRAIWSDDLLSDSEKVERMKWLNEIMHRLTTKTAALRLNKNDFSEADTWAMIEHYTSLCPGLAAEVATATIRSYQYAVR
jgi:hypothetical protein